MKCLFCQIVQREKEADIVAENEGALAILDAFPVSDGHILLISKKHFTNIAEVEGETWNYFLPLIKSIITKLTTVFQPSGFNIISNMGGVAYQSIFHLHLHLIPKYEKEKGFLWNNKPELRHSLNQVIQKLLSLSEKNNKN